MPDHTDPHPAGPADRHDRRGTGVYPAGIFWALVLLVVAVIGISGSYAWIAHPATRWVVAGGVAVIGLGLLLTALPRRSRD